MSHQLQGLMKWVERDEWSEELAELFSLHVGPACMDLDVELDETLPLLGLDTCDMLWACIFEDFCTREFGGGRNLVDDYLKRRGWKENAPTRTYMMGLRSSVMSLYEVSDVIPGKSFVARDLLRGGEPQLVSERSGTRVLKAWDRVAARIVQEGSKTVVGGGLLRFDLETGDAVFELFHKQLKQARKKARGKARRSGVKLAAPVEQVVLETDLLRDFAPIFTMMWLHDALERVLKIGRPQLRNTDGDELVFSTAHYKLKSADASALRNTLDGLHGFEPASDTLWNWMGQDKPAPRLPPPDGVTTIMTQSVDGRTVLGNIELKKSELCFSTNSRERMERGRALLAPALRGLVDEPLIEMETLEQMIADSGSKAPLPHSSLSEDEERAFIHEHLRRHYTEVLDQRIPMLGNVSPRQAVKTAKGRDKVVAWLKAMENHAAMSEAGSPLATYEFRWLWQTLGIEDLRR